LPASSRTLVVAGRKEYRCNSRPEVVEEAAEALANQNPIDGGSPAIESLASQWVPRRSSETPDACWPSVSVSVCAARPESRRDTLQPTPHRTNPRGPAQPPARRPGRPARRGRKGKAGETGHSKPIQREQGLPPAQPSPSPKSGRRGEPTVSHPQTSRPAQQETGTQAGAGCRRHATGLQRQATGQREGRQPAALDKVGALRQEGPGHP